MAPAKHNSNVNNNDRRVKRTKKVLRDALFHLLDQKSVNQITVTELTELADVNRATFYFYYTDIFDMLEQIQNEAYDLFSELMIEDNSSVNVDNELADYITKFLIFCRDNKTLCRFVIKNDSNNQMFRRVKNIITSNIPKSREIFAENDPRRYLTDFALTAMTGLMIDWMDENMVIEPRVMADFMANVYLNGSLFAKNSYNSAGKVEASSSGEKEPLEEMSAFFNSRSAAYDETHLSGISGGKDTKDIIASILPEKCKNLLDIGIGTGIELEKIYERFPEISVTGVDFAEKMTDILKEKYPDKNIDISNSNFIEYSYPTDKYDACVSVMALHHYRPETKVLLYKKIYSALKSGGVYIESDYILTGNNAFNEQERLLSEYDKRVATEGLNPEKEYHFDTPCCVDTEIKALNAAGFKNVTVVKEFGTTLIIKAMK